ncbi:MAG: hypothetical protein RR932_12305 [Acinetobacter sp.]
MKNLQYISPLFKLLLKNRFFIGGRAVARSFYYFNYFSRKLPRLEWDINADFPFNPELIPKIKNRKIRKACYQSFALYKKSFKPRPKPKLKIIWDEWKTDDLADAVAYSFFSLSLQTKQEFEKQYLCCWDLATEDPKNAS